MWVLQHYVNAQLNIVPDVESPKAYRRLDGQAKLKVREA